MRKWRAENREKNRQNDLRCRVYRCARQKFGDQDSMEKQQFIRDEISRRLGRKINTKSTSTSSSSASSPYSSTSVFSSASPPPSHHRTNHSCSRRHQYQSSFIYNFTDEDDNDDDDTEMKDEIDDDDEDDDDNEENRTLKTELPFYNLPHQKIQLPSIDSLCPPLVSSTNLRRRTSYSSESSISTTDESLPSTSSSSELTLPPVHTFLYPFQQQQQQQPLPSNIKNNDNTKILDEFVGVVLDYAQDSDHRHHSRH